MTVVVWTLLVIDGGSRAPRVSVHGSEGDARRRLAEEPLGPDAEVIIDTHRVAVDVPGVRAGWAGLAPVVRVDPDEALRAAGIPVERVDPAETAEDLEALMRRSARLRAAEEGRQ